MSTFYFPAVIVVALSLSSVSAQANGGNKESTDKDTKYADFTYQEKFDELTQAEHTQAKRTALKASIRPLVACADPGNMPISNKKEEGYDNRIAKLLAQSMGTSLRFFWRSYLERGLTRETFLNKECDLLLGMPFTYAHILTTIPIYRSSYVFAYHQDRDYQFKRLDDPGLADLKIGTYQHSGIREALFRYGFGNNIQVHVIRQDTDLIPAHQQWTQVMQLVDGSLDIVGVWGPFAGYAKLKKNAPIVIRPVNLMEDRTPLEFSLAIGMRETDVILKYALDHAIEKNAATIESILKEYGVPLISCSDCAVQGDLPSHGSYYERFIDDAKARYLQPLAREQVQINKKEASADQIVSQERLDSWLQEGADLNMELGNAVLASDAERVSYLIQLGADLNHLNNQGYGLLHDSARYRDSDMIDLLLKFGADLNLIDKNGWTPLMHAAFLNHVPSIKSLVKGGSDLEVKSNTQYTVLAIAIGERKFWAAKALLELGADVNSSVGEKHMSPLMLAALHRKSSSRGKKAIEGMEPVELVELLIKKGGDVNARTVNGETALMFAAARNNLPVIASLIQQGANVSIKSKKGDTALDIAKENRSDNAVKSLQFFSGFQEKKRLD